VKGVQTWEKLVLIQILVIQFGYDSLIRWVKTDTPPHPVSLQGYLAHKEMPTPLGSSEDPRHRPTVWS